LTEDEFKDSLDRKLSEYYRFLGRRLLLERDPGFWSYHERAFARLGIPFRRSRLAMAAVGQLAASAFSPKSTWTSIKRLFALKKLRNLQMRKVVSSFEEDRANATQERVPPS